MALFFNVKVSLTDPFIRIDNAALAQGSNPSCENQYTDDFKLVDRGKWCGSYFTFYQTCEFFPGQKCACIYVDEEDCS
jgi:hypothetical protein